MKIWEIDEAIQSLVDDETGEIMDFEAFESLQMERDSKIQNIIKWYKNEKSDAEKIKAESQALAERARIAQNRAERLKAYLEHITAGQPYKSAVGDISYRKSVRVDIADGTELADDYVRVKREPDKTKLKDLLKQGMEILGVSLVESQSMTIK